VRIEALELLVDRHRVEVHAGGRVLGVGRWTGHRIVERSASELSEGEWDLIAQRLAREEATALEAAAASAHDESGVDLTLIDWMLTLTPTERLEVLRRHAAGLARFVRDDAAE
jgi:hypothetical protein